MRRVLKQLILATVRRTCGARAHGELARAMAGVGFVFAMHRVVERKSDSPAPKLTTTTEFLDQALTFLREAGVEFISLSTLRQRLVAGGPFTRPFACLTFDDGYRDNLTLALPILRRHQAPATVFTPSGCPDRTMDVWFLRLDKAVMSNDEIRLDLPGVPPVLAARTPAEKCDAYQLLSRYVHQDITRNKSAIQRLLPPERISDEALAVEQLMSWSELRELADDPLMTIGGHTVNHPVLRDLKEDDALREMTVGRDRLVAELDRPVDLFSYPYGGREEIGRRELKLARRAGFRLAVTTLYDQIRPGHGEQLFAIPRIGLGALREDLAALAFDVVGCVAPGSRNPAAVTPAADLGPDLGMGQRSPGPFS